VALIAGVILFSLSSGKRHSYMLPLQPFVAIQCALLFSMFLERRGLPARERLWRIAYRVEGVAAGLVVLMLMSAGIGHQVDWGHHPLEEIVKFACAPLTFRAGLVSLVSLAIIALLKRRDTRLPYGRLWFLIVLIMTLCVAAGNVVKGTMKSWPIMTEQLLLITKSGQTITVIKDTFDEYFDPIFFYAHQPISILSDSKGIERCDPGTVYVARRTWILRNPDLIPGDIKRLTTLKELRRAFSGGKGEDIEVFSCSPHSRHSDHSQENLRDAAFTS
jgi:hypothetical protein